MGRKHLTHSQQLDRWENSINKTIQKTKDRIEKLKHLIVEEEGHILSNENLKINIRRTE